MRAVLSILLLLNCCSNTIFCQTVKLEWAKQVSGNSFDACQAITLDDAGNVYATGYFSNTVDFDPGPGVFNLSSIAAEDIFISKSDAAGNLIWAKSIGEFRYQAGYAIALDAEKNIYVTGIFFGTVDFDPGPATSQLTAAGNEDVFICKLDNNGNFKWAKNIGGTTNEYSNAIILDQAGNIYLNGYFDGTADFDPGTGTYNLTAFGQTDIFVCKLSNQGNLIWARQMGGTSAESAYSIALDEQNNVYSTGFFFGTADFDPGPATINLQSSGFGDGFIVKLNANGGLVKVAKMGGSEKVRCISLKSDKTGHFFVSGYFDGVADFDPGADTALLSSPAGDEDIFIAKYDLNLTLVWVKQIGGPLFQKVLALDIDATGNVYATGNFNGSADFDPGAGDFVLSTAVDPNLFVVKLNAAGDFIWAAKSDGIFFSGGYSIKIGNSNTIFVGGTFEGTTDFDPGVAQYNLTPEGNSEIVMLKLKQCPNSAISNTLNIISCSAYTLNNKRYDTSGVYMQSIVNSMGCDSIIITLNLTVQRITNNIAINICKGQSFYAGGKLQINPGVYYDTLQTLSGCDSVVITHLTVNPNPQPNLGVSRNICAGVSSIMDPGNFTTYLWQDQSTQPTFTATTPGIYSVTVTNQYNCRATASVTLKNIVSPPGNFLPASQALCSGNVLKLDVSGYKNYLWSTGASTQDIAIRTAGTYYLTVTSWDNCTGSDTVVVNEISCVPTGIPNAFTPNNDGINDHFRPVINLEIKDYQLKIFNRLGQLIFETQNNTRGWDGTFKNQPQATGAYVYQINFRNINGKLFTYSGNITLIR